MSPDRVSIVLASRNGVPHLDRAIASVVAQSHKEWELVLVDDGSTDATGEHMNAWASRDPRIRVVHAVGGRGLAGALNLGFRHARGDFLGWTGDRGGYAPNAIERMLAVLAEPPSPDAVFADHVCCGEGAAERRVRVGPVERLRLENVVGPCFLYRRELFEELAGLDESPGLAAEYDFWLRASTRFRLEPLHEPLYRCRACAAQETGPAGWRAVERHLHALPAAQRAETRLHWALLLLRAGALRQAGGVLLSGLLERRRSGRRSTSRVSRTRILAPDVLGGVASLMEDLARARPADATPVELCWTRARSSRYSPRAAAEKTDLPRELSVEHDYPRESLFAVLRRMRRALSPGPGVIVANDYLSLAYAARHGGDCQVVQILHGDEALHYDLACRFAPWVDAFVAVSQRIHDSLCERLPQRADDVHHLPSGIPIPSRVRRPVDGPLRLVYTGRLEHRKGVLELPAIDRIATQAGASLRWTLVGSGPEEAELRARFAGDPRVRFTGGLAPQRVRALLPDHDVLVLPSHIEGLPICLLEAMAAGLVPVASDLASGIRELVTPGVTGWLGRPHEPGGFAEAIVRLDADRVLLERSSRAAAELVRESYAIEDRAAAYYGLFEQLEGRGARRRPRFRRGPSRLDRPWLPSAVVRVIRGLQR